MNSWKSVESAACLPLYRYLGGVLVDERRRDRLEHVDDGLADTLAAVALRLVVAQLDGLMRAGRGA